MIRTRRNRRNRTRRNRTRRNRIRKGGKNCKSICKTEFLKEIKQDKRYKSMQNLFYLFGINADEEAKSVLDSKEITDDPVFKDCIKKCNKY